jgi:hypothetical protein
MSAPSTAFCQESALSESALSGKRLVWKSSRRVALRTPRARGAFAISSNLPLQSWIIQEGADLGKPS